MALVNQRRMDRYQDGGTVNFIDYQLRYDRKLHAHNWISVHAELMCVNTHPLMEIEIFQLVDWLNKTIS